MTCLHKFNRYLRCENLNFQPQILIIGTFNPEWPIENYANWFYGRTNNNYFWNVLPRMFGDESLLHLGTSNWKNYCNNKRIAITDLIKSIDDASQENPYHFEIISKFKDTEFAENFNEFQFTNVIDILRSNPSINKVYFTRNRGVELFDSLIQTIINYCNENEIYFSYLLTPSKNARFQMKGWKPLNPNLERSLPNFIYEKWMENWN